MPEAKGSRTIFALRRRGYDLIHHVYQDHTFLRRNCGISA